MTEDLKPKTYLLFAREQTSHDWTSNVYVYESLYPKELKKRLAEGWAVIGKGERLICHTSKKELLLRRKKSFGR